MNKLIVLSGMGLLLLSGQEAMALVCPDPHQSGGTAWCDPPPSDPPLPSRYEGEVLCLVEPVEGPANSTIDEEVVGGGVCVLGKFKTTQDVQGVVDFVISYDFAGIIDDPLEAPWGLFVPDLAGLASSTEFQTTLPLELEGPYDISVHASVLQEDGSIVALPIDPRRVLRVAVPHLTVTGARVGDTNAPVSESGGDGDGDGICDGPDPIEGLCAAGPDSEDNNGAAEPPHVVEVTSPTIPAKSLNLCVNSHDAETNAGTSIVVHAVNTITDSSVAPTREIVVEASCAGPGETVCQPSSDSSCLGGFEINVPLGHGQNQIDLLVNNLVTGYDIGAAQEITILPFNVDLKGPSLCVSYLDEAGAPIPNVDNKALLASEADSVMVDVMLGACGGNPEEVTLPTLPEDAPECNPESPEPDAGNNWPVTLKRNNEATYVKMCEREIGGKKHYQARFNELRFPINTVNIKAVDGIGNQTVETHSFGYGNVRSLFNAEGQFDLTPAIVPNGLGGFVPEGFVQNELKPLILQVVNSDKFKNEMFPKLLEPRQPGDEEIACLQQIEDTVNCTFDHLASRERVVAFKMFCDGDCTDNIGEIQVPSLYLLNQDRIRVQLKINGLHSRAEMYTIRFIDSDDDGVVDTEDDDDDGDGIKDEDEEDDDGDGVSDDHDLPGLLVADPDFNTFIVPVKFTIQEMALNLDVQFQKDNDGRLRLVITNPPGRNLLEIISDNQFPIEFDCEKDVSEIYGGGGPDSPQNGRNLWTGGEVCRALERLNPTADSLPEDNTKERASQGIKKQLRCTIDAIARCSTPKRLEAQLDKFDDQKVMGTSMELLGNRFHVDFFAPLGSADVTVDPRGVGFKGSGLLLPAGVTDPEDEAERNAVDFLNTLPAEFKNSKFGPLSEADDGGPPDPIVAALEMGGEMNLALKEETINSMLHSVGVLLWDLARKEGDAHQTLDMTATRMREDFGMGIPDIGAAECKDKEGNIVPQNSWECFPYPLNMENVIGTVPLSYVDFDGDGISGAVNGIPIDVNDSQTPVLLRNNLNPFIPPTARVVNVTPLDASDGSGTAVVFAELEIGLGNAAMSVFEEQVENWSATPIRGTGEIKDWCDADRFPGANPTRCGAGQKTPIATFGVSGRVFVTLLLSVHDDGLIRAEGGLSSVEGSQEAPTAGEEMVLDTSKTYLEFTVIENNTIIPDNELAAAMKGKIDLILPKYLFGNARDIRLKIPAQVPLQAFCDRYAADMPELCDCVENPEGEDCENIGLIQDMWDDLNLDEDFGIEGLTLVQPVLGVTGENLGPTRYLTVGIGADFDLGGE